MLLLQSTQRHFVSWIKERLQQQQRRLQPRLIRTMSRSVRSSLDHASPCAIHDVNPSGSLAAPADASGTCAHATAVPCGPLVFALAPPNSAIKQTNTRRSCGSVSVIIPKDRGGAYLTEMWLFLLTTLHRICI